jgi:hypothetical protein
VPLAPVVSRLKSKPLDRGDSLPMLSGKHVEKRMRFRIAKRRGTVVTPIPDAPTFDNERDARAWIEAYPELIQRGLEAFELIPEGSDA